MFTPLPPKEKCILISKAVSGVKYKVCILPIKEDQEVIPWVIEFRLYRIDEYGSQIQLSSAIFNNAVDLQQGEIQVPIEDSIKDFAQLMINDFDDSWHSAKLLYDTAKQMPEVKFPELLDGER